MGNDSAATGPLLEATRSVPIVFVIVPDPVGAGYVDSLARPGGNATGFTTFEYGIGGKWRKEIAPHMTRAAVLRDPALAAGIGQFAAIQSNASSSAVELSAIDTRDVGEIERTVVAFARKPNGGLVVTASASALIHRDQIIALATRLRLPNVYPFRYYPSNGGLASYGPNQIDQYKRAAGYVDPQGREAGRLAGASADEVRVGGQPQDREGARSGNPDNRARPRRRGD